MPVHAMRIFGDESSSLEFDAYGAGVLELAWIVEDALLQNALWRDLDVQVYCPAEIESLEIDGEHAVLRLRDGRKLSTGLVVGADGANSLVREQAGIPARDRDYGQSAVVANFSCETPHGNVAYQWFQRGAVLALLPLAGTTSRWCGPCPRPKREEFHSFAAKSFAGRWKPLRAACSAA